MDKRSAVIVLMLGLVQIMPVVLMMIAGVGMNETLFTVVSFMTVWVPVSGAFLIAWGVWSLVRRSKPNA